MDWCIWHWIGLPSRKDIKGLSSLVEAENLKRAEIQEQELGRIRTAGEDLITKMAGQFAENIKRQKELVEKIESSAKDVCENLAQCQAALKKHIGDEYAEQKIVLAALAEGLTAKYDGYVTILKQTQGAIEKDCDSLMKAIRREMTNLGTIMHKDAEEGRKSLSGMVDAGLNKLEAAQRATEREFSKMAKDLFGVVEAVEDRLKKETESTNKSIDRLTVAAQDASLSLNKEVCEMSTRMTQLIGDCRSAVVAVLDQTTTTTAQMDKILEQFDAMQESFRLYMINALIDSLSLKSSQSADEVGRQRLKAWKEEEKNRQRTGMWRLDDQ